MLPFLLTLPLLQQADLAARGPGVTVTVPELEALLVDRYALSQQGRESLELMLKSELLSVLAEKAGVVVSDEDVSRRWNQLDRQTRASNPAGLEGILREQNLEVDEFREFLRLAIVQERLTRQALGIGSDEVVTEAQQEVWLAQEMGERGLERPKPPWEDGIAARCGEAVVHADEYARFLCERLESEEVREAAWHLLLLRGIERRMPDLAPEARANAVAAEIELRRREHERDFAGISFEQRLGAVGRSLAQLERDPSVHIAALSRLWVDRTHGDDGLRATFEKERAYFEGRFGRAARAYMLFLVAGRFVNDLVPRTFEAAESELEDMRARIGDVHDFGALVESFSEDSTWRSRRGDLGFVTRIEPEQVPPKVRTAVMDFVDTGGEVPAEGTPVGPVRLDNGVALLWITEIRPSPPWEVMREHVHAELRRRFVIDVLPTGSMEFLLGGPR